MTFQVQFRVLFQMPIAIKPTTPKLSSKQSHHFTKLRVSQVRTLCTPALEWLWGSLNNRRRPGRFAWGRMSEARIMDSRWIPRFSPTSYKLRLKHRRQLLRSDIGTWRKGWVVGAHWTALPRASQGLGFLTAWQSPSTQTWHGSWLPSEQTFQKRRCYFFRAWLRHHVCHITRSMHSRNRARCKGRGQKCFLLMEKRVREFVDTLTPSQGPSSRLHGYMHLPNHDL